MDYFYVELRPEKKKDRPRRALINRNQITMIEESRKTGRVKVWMGASGSILLDGSIAAVLRATPATVMRESQ